MTMIRRLAATLILLAAACSRGAPPPDNAVARATPVATPAPPAAGDVDTHTQPRPGVLKTFGDWTVGCDNVSTCTLASLGPDGGDFPAATVAAIRAAGPDGGWMVQFGPQDGNGDAHAATPADATVDGAAFDPVRDAAGLVAAMANGHRLAIRDAAGKTITDQSLTGAAAALRYVDAQQGRAGTVTAIVAKGPKPATAVPAEPPQPVILAVPPGAGAELPPAAALKALSKRAECEDRAPADYWTPQARALGGGATLVLIPCSAGAYNILSALFVTKGGKTVPATADAPMGFAATGAEGVGVPSVVNGDFTDGVLTSDAKGRGLGDCGDSQRFVWDGTRFRLSEQDDMGDCRGNPDYIPTWQAKVVRK